MSTTVSNRVLLYEAMVAKYESEIKEAIATLNIYLSSPVGIGEHPQHLEEMDKLMDQLSTAQDKLDNIRHYFNHTGEVNAHVLSLNGAKKQEV